MPMSHGVPIDTSLPKIQIPVASNHIDTLPCLMTFQPLIKTKPLQLCDITDARVLLICNYIWMGPKNRMANDLPNLYTALINLSMLLKFT